ncbi:hypothetical protein Patl1_30096 [Pistacia atlantica]|uniref:Uncharacterized protein n=1 Tax=Pistacia atlantica TaxID=434234 RepID=A0ACC1ABI7_9ROSI|nr:hypothetical protein Patl1_30096 [Pistacia atlantica]
MVNPPKKQFLLFSLFALFFFSYYHHSSLPISSDPNPSLTQNVNVFPNHFPQNFTLIIKLLTFNRLNSLSRCLHSLAAADYLSETVHLHIYIDHFALPNNNHSSESTDFYLEESRRILRFVEGFKWKFGEKFVHYRTGNVGLQAQWLEAWWPSSDHEFAFVVEDDLEVSPLFYKFLRDLIVNYYYNSSNSSQSIYGASLQRPRFVPGKHGSKIHLDSGTHLFLYQLVGTWGQLLFPKPWKEFRFWYDEHKAKDIKPFLDGMVTTGWYKKMGERIWTPWFIKFIHSRGYFNFYTNFQNERALSVSHRDAGVNYGKSAGPDSQLLDESSLDFNFLDMQPLSNLKWYDFCFREVFLGRVVRSMDELGSVLHAVQKQETVLLVSLFGASEVVIRNLLCHFERVNIRNYLLIGPHSELLFDLARRGHPVVDADQFLQNIRAYKFMKFQDSNGRFTNEVFVKAYVIKKCLEFRYNSWVVNGNLLFVNSDFFLQSIDATADFLVAKSLELGHIRSSSAVQKIWTDDFLFEVATMVDKISLPRARRSFAYIVTNLLEQKGSVAIKRINETNVGMVLDAENANRSSLEVGKKLVYWSTELGLDIVQKRLKELSMWIIDGDSSCLAVICHQS